MKRGIIALIILLLVVIVSVSGLFILKNITDNLYALADEMQASIEIDDYDKTKKSINAFIESWEKNKYKLIHIVHLQNIENINDFVAMLNPLLEKGSNSSLLVTVSRLKVLIEDLYDNELPSIHNIF